MTPTSSHAEPAGTRPTLPSQIAQQRVIAVLRGLPPDRLPQVVGALVAAGVGAVEVTLDSERAIESISRLRADLAHDVVVGAGTVERLEQAREAVAAGAMFLLAPHTDVEVVRWAADEGVAMVPGALSPTEIMTAWHAGAAAVKLFPASLVGPAYLSALPGPLRRIPIVPTGGIDAVTAPAFLAAGAVAVGTGSGLVRGGDPEVIGARARELVAAVATP